MNDEEWLAAQFEEHRPRLRAVAYRMLGSFADAEDALQDAWVRIARAEVSPAEIDNPAGWLTTIVGRVCLNALRSRKARREETWDTWDGHLPDPVVTDEGPLGPEESALLADSVGLALQIVLDALSPDERLAFVLHDMFEVPFPEIAAVLDREAAATRQLASRARRRVADAGAPAPDRDLARQRVVVDAFYAAAREGDLDALVSVLHPDVVGRADFGALQLPRPALIRGAETVAQNARIGYTPGAELRPVLVNGAAATLVLREGRPYVLMAFTVVEERIVAIDIYGDPSRLSEVAASVL
ncbi:sigma-70 family RNA polymerase sigma factor [Streptacidiphilus jiangxiensis]|uniref:RNA polymerase sigma-70 factor, ECF subfamily n=1 Tax=Streptacidiphilus jiangxiensis TaxID=235985 RepID=A0A1H7WSP9_STRJI|nr:sigma-70 family RNA polymerase sigma factor [Streptacidiphilus jiangxiensis]SEM24590.1 RNA polymerase sigma-70 factor, ECF subfamily [Streptacidiphilus jiangxiensis]